MSSMDRQRSHATFLRSYDASASLDGSDLQVILSNWIAGIAYASMLHLYCYGQSKTSPGASKDRLREALSYAVARVFQGTPFVA